MTGGGGWMPDMEDRAAAFFAVSAKEPIGSRCDHGIALDRYFGDCELTLDTWDQEWHREQRRRSRVLAAGLLLVAALVVGIAWVVSR